LTATLLKKGLTENFSNNMVGVINRRNGCGTTLLKKGLTENISNDEIDIVTIADQGLRFRRNGSRL